MTGLVLRVALLGVLVLFLLVPQMFADVLALLARRGQPAIYPYNSLLALALSHLTMVALATLAATAVALGLAIFVTRPAGAEFLPLSRSLANIGQTFPPVAVLAIAVPVFGFGPGPTLAALFLYGLLPIFENAIAGLTTLPAAVVEAARGMGMTRWQRLTEVELPLALPVILAGIRLSAVIAVSTATIGSTVAASTLGEVIMAGLFSANLAYVVQGGFVVAALAILINDGLAALERRAVERRESAGRP